MGTLGDGDAGANAGPDAKKQDDLYENRSGHKKIIRVVTVMAYMVSVSFVAIVLSAYYVFLWQPPNPRLMHRSHLRADPQVEYLVHGPQIESSHEEVIQGHTDDLDKVYVLDEKVSIENQQDSSSGGPKILKVIEVDPRSKDENKSSDYSTISTTLWSPIVRALLATTGNPMNDGMPVDSTGVYDSLDVTVKSSLSAASLETSNSEINGSTIRGAVESTTMIGGGDSFYDESVNHSTPTIGSEHKSDNVLVNYSKPTDFGGSVVGNGESDGKSSDNSSEADGTNFDRDSGNFTTMRAFEFLEKSVNLKPEVQPISIGLEEKNVGTVETSGKSVKTRTQESFESLRNFRPEVQPISIGLEERNVETSGKSVNRRTQQSLENSRNFRPEVQPISIGLEERNVETSGKSVKTRMQESVENLTNLKPEVQPISLGLEERNVETSGKSVKTRTQESLENLRNFRPEVQPISIGLEERNVETSGKSVKRRTQQSLENLRNFRPEVQPISIGLEERNVETSGKSVKTRTQKSLENLTNLKPEVQPISLVLEERNVETSGKSVKTTTQESLKNSRNLRPEVQPISIRFQERTVETSEKSMTTRTHESLENSTNLRPEVQPVSIGLEEKNVGTVETSGKSVKTRTQESLENSTNHRPEVQPISMRLQERNVEISEKSMTTKTHESLENSTNLTPEVQSKSGSTEAQPETLGTTVAPVQQRSFDWKPLGFTEPSTKLGSSISRVETKSPTNDTESVGKFSSTFQANEDAPIEIIAGLPGDRELASEPSASAVPAVVQPESDFLDKDRESRDRLTQDGDFGFV